MLNHTLNATMAENIMCGVSRDEPSNRGLKPDALYLRGGMAFLLHGPSSEAQRHLEQAVSCL